MNSFSILNSLPLLCLVLATTWTSFVLIRGANADDNNNSISSNKWSKITVAEYDAKEYSFLHDINMKRVAKGESQLKPSRLLTNYAQREANRMAKISGLVYPQIDFLDHHFGYAIKISGKNGRTLAGQKICFDNLFTPADTSIHDLNYNCNSKQLVQELAYEVGYGRTVDVYNQIFIVRLFRTSQTSSNSKQQ